MLADLTRNVRIYVARNGDFAHAAVGSNRQTKLLLANKGYRLCASAERDAQVWYVVEKLCARGCSGIYFIRGLSIPPTDEELKRLGEQIEAELQSMKTENGTAS